MGARAKSFKCRIEDFEAEDIRAFYDSSMLRVWHLQGKARTYRIARVQRITKQEGDEVEKRAVLRLVNSKGEELPLPLELNATNRDTVRALYGDKPRAWIGRLIELYPTTCEAFGKMQDCIRIRNYDPATRQRPAYTNRQGVHVLPGPTDAAPPAQRQSQPPAPPADESSGLELDDDSDGDQVERTSYVDTTDDQEEPPFGSLLEDNRIR